MTEQKKFYFSDGKEVFGPYTAGQLRQYALAGHVKPESFVCVGESGDWVPASKINGLFDATGQVISAENKGKKASPRESWKSDGSGTPAANQPTGSNPSVGPAQPQVPQQAMPTAKPVQPVAAQPVLPNVNPNPTPKVEVTPVRSNFGAAPVAINTDPTPRSASTSSRSGKSYPPGSWLEPIAIAISEPFGTGASRAKLWWLAIMSYGIAIATYPLSFVVVITAYDHWSTMMKRDGGTSFVVTILLSQVIALLLMFLGHYIIQKMAEPNDAILERPFVTKNVKPYFCVGVALVVGGILFFLAGIWLGLLAEDYQVLVILWLVGIGFYSAANFLFHPERLFITESEEATPADSALSFLAFWFKLPILVLPGSIAVASCIAIFLNVTGPIFQLALYLDMLKPSAFTMGYATAPYTIPWLLGILGVLPLLAFFIASITSIFIDVVNSIYQIAKNTA